ncbi:hypothetical protein [Amycolatopsis orientalis]|uniref:hypothetical protein n=1 Tax=Amycolatopsis orientalis TaxID=31958 RepID=UPI00039C7AB6|nr:hypothetical protein [Amycolatopsis orientalis]
MSGGFGAVPEELFRTANSIGDVIGSAAGLLWQGPSGDYGHPGVQAGWAGFVEEIQAEVARLTEIAEGHGDDLRTAAGKYAQSDAAATGTIGKFGAGLGGLFGEAAGGGTPFAGVEAQAEAKIGNSLEGAPGGGFTGGLTPSQLNERLGEPEEGLHDVPGGGWTGGATGRISGSIDDDGPMRIMSPERSRQLFPGSSGGELGPVF